MFGRAETDLERERRERHEADLRRNRDAAGNARRRADEIEAERKAEWQRIQEEGRAKMAWPKPAAVDPGTAAEAARLAGESERHRRQEHQSLRGSVVQEALSARAAKETALASGDIEAYVAAHGRYAALDALVHELDRTEQDRQQVAATPTMHGTARL